MRRVFDSRWMLPFAAVLCLAWSRAVCGASAAQGGLCPPTTASFALPCECGGAACAGSVQVTPSFVPDCEGCSFTFTMQLTCPNCSQPASSGSSGIVCVSRERHALACPADPYDDALVLYLECGQCP